MDYQATRHGPGPTTARAMSPYQVARDLRELALAIEFGKAPDLDSVRVTTFDDGARITTEYGPITRPDGLRV
jgi:hypothetical protein